MCIYMFQSFFGNTYHAPSNNTQIKYIMQKQLILIITAICFVVTSELYAQDFRTKTETVVQETENG